VPRQTGADPGGAEQHAVPEGRRQGDAPVSSLKASEHHMTFDLTSAQEQQTCYLIDNVFVSYVCPS